MKNIPIDIFKGEDLLLLSPKDKNGKSSMKIEFEIENSS